MRKAEGYLYCDLCMFIIVEKEIDLKQVVRNAVYQGKAQKGGR